ncbi:MAG: hypothetical protein ACYSSL_03665 [Planctomycetota bacterium]
MSTKKGSKEAYIHLSVSSKLRAGILQLSELLRTEPRPATVPPQLERLAARYRQYIRFVKSSLTACKEKEQKIILQSMG